MKMIVTVSFSFHWHNGFTRALNRDGAYFKISFEKGCLVEGGAYRKEDLNRAFAVSLIFQLAYSNTLYCYCQHICFISLLNSCFVQHTLFYSYKYTATYIISLYSDENTKGSRIVIFRKCEGYDILHGILCLPISFKKPCLQASYKYVKVLNGVRFEFEFISRSKIHYEQQGVLNRSLIICSDDWKGMEVIFVCDWFCR